MKTRNKPPRAWSDWHVASHLAFVPAVLWAAGRRPVFWELLVLLLPVVVCSTAYHRQREPRGSLIARLDCGFAYGLYAYGLAQAWAAAGAWRAMYVAGAALVASTFLESTALVPAARAFTRPPPGYRPFNDTIDGYKLFRPEDWIEVKGSGNDVFFRNPSSVEENMFVSISSPSSTKFASPRDLGTPDEAAQKILAQYLNEFMSSRLGVRRESSVVSAREREGTDVDGEPMLFYDVELRIKSYAAKNQYGLTEADRPQFLEWDRTLSSTLGVANNRLYELRFQTSALDVDEAEWRARYGVIKDSFKPFDVDQSNLSFPLF